MICKTFLLGCITSWVNCCPLACDESLIVKIRSISTMISTVQYIWRWWAPGHQVQYLSSLLLKGRVGQALCSLGLNHASGSSLYNFLEKEKTCASTRFLASLPNLCSISSVCLLLGIPIVASRSPEFASIYPSQPPPPPLTLLHTTEALLCRAWRSLLARRQH